MDPDHIPQFPPPPYSETSEPGPLTPATSQADNALSASLSSVDEAIYTPSYSPTVSVHQGQASRDDFDLISSSSASAYFESRPPCRFVSGSPEIYRITITARTGPQDLPYPTHFGTLDCMAQDWATFVNYLLPDHVAEANNDVADRKLRAEVVEDMHKLGLNQGGRSRSDASEVNAQLQHLRQQTSSNTTEKLRAAELTISEWNEGFFRPRGIHITSIDQNAETAAGVESSRKTSSRIPWQEPKSSRNSRRGFLRNPFIEAGPQGFRMGPIIANNEGFRIGRSLVANNEGFRLGNVLVSDQRGFRLGGSRGFVKDPDGVSVGGRMFGRRESDPRGRGRHGHHCGHHMGRGRSHSHGRHRRERSSSASSSSSFSSSNSDSSFGSLPEYDDLSDEQLPAVKLSLVEWLHHPEQPITKDFIQSVRKDIKASKVPSSPQLSRQEIKRMRTEVKDLLKLLKECRKTQRRQAKEARRERRVARRLEKKARRAARKEGRKDKKAKRPRDGNGEGIGPFWMASPRSFMPNQPSLPSPTNTIPPTSPGGTLGSFGRAASVPFLKGPPFGQPGRLGMQAMHGGWPFTQGLPYAPGRISVPNDMMYITPISRSAENIHTQALQMEQAAKLKDSRAIELRTAATRRSIGEKQRFRDLDLAAQLEEEAENYRIEADRLRAEALHLDRELVRELEEDRGQTSGVIQN